MIEVTSMDVDKVDENGQTKYVIRREYQTYVNPDSVSIIHAWPYPDSKWCAVIAAGKMIVIKSPAVEAGPYFHKAQVAQAVKRQMEG